MTKVIPPSSFKPIRPSSSTPWRPMHRLWILPVVALCMQLFLAWGAVRQPGPIAHATIGASPGAIEHFARAEVGDVRITGLQSKGPAWRPAPAASAGSGLRFPFALRPRPRGTRAWESGRGPCAPTCQRLPYHATAPPLS